MIKCDAICIFTIYIYRAWPVHRGTPGLHPLHSTTHEYGSLVSVHVSNGIILRAPPFQVVVTGNDIHPNTDMCSHSLNRARIYAIETCSDIIILIICVHILR